ncbi:hypothetical protein WOLCODRAFT_147744 [Wolfiporia cocos MD-104 SS10]|uniref:Rad21/Rec8-like protein N-terminal domain-containing protein n=1 Tax=Wolfiporia cocos (strain MD-104) TaxID=742152 RepID=A0A2H3IUK0_WOLCO|nr:hypothetical protein WOLCODRAFT_147744 [Wolfiporia cocos MD-104 SS10]
MFFTQELLEKRESGFGLLWLAATLGARSSFKKLPKRSVLTADITQLCDLIAEPSEPLALRLSSNLMIGVARVYKVKQEIFHTDVTTCYNSLKKAVQEFHTLSKAELQMGQPSLRPDALTLAADPGAAFAMDFGNMLWDWDESRRSGKPESDGEESEDDYDPTSGKKGKKKQKARPKPPSSVIENIRANAHTLDEHHELILSGSFDGSFHGAGFGGVLPSSSQIDGGFGFSDDIFGLQEDMDLGGGIGDELARELGEGWGGSPDKRRNASQADADMFAFSQDDMNIAGGFQFGDIQPDAQEKQSPDLRQPGTVPDEEQYPEGSIVVPLMPFSPDRDGNIQMQVETGEGADQDGTEKPAQRQAKRVRLLLDARTELTDEELKAARANYVEGQDSLRREIDQKKFEKESGKIIEQMIWGVPHGLQAPVLIDFWLENFRVQVEAQAGTPPDQRPTKRRKISDGGVQAEPAFGDAYAQVDAGQFEGAGADTGFMFGINDFNVNDTAQDGPPYEPDSRLRSSEEPGLARRASRPPSVFGSQFDIPGAGQEFLSGSQRSALFPWDNAGAGVSSSVQGGTFDFGREGSATRRSIDRASTKLRGSSISSRRESPLPGGRILDSPAGFGVRNSPLGDGFEFDVPGEDSVLAESQQSDLNLLTLERNSYNFLEYAKMQLKTFPSTTSTLTFDDVVPKAASTPHVAAAAFYHCLVLATKDLVNVAQEEPYGTLRITVK